MRKLLTVTMMLIAGSLGAGEAADAGLDDPRVQEVLTMVGGGLSLSVILAEVEDIGAFPELDAGDLVALKEAGVPERVLVRMIQLEQTEPVAPVAVAPPPDLPVSDPAATATVRVELQRDYWITFYEVQVDGDVMASAGKLWEGESDPGQKLRRPGRVREPRRFTALELDVEPGEHEIAVGFAVTLLEDDADETDDWDKFTIEHYVNRGVRATAAAAGQYPGQWGTPSKTTCILAAGETCTVVATLERRAPTALGGIPIYGVSYTTDVR